MAGTVAIRASTRARARTSTSTSTSTSTIARARAQRQRQQPHHHITLPHAHRRPLRGPQQRGHGVQGQGRGAEEGVGHAEQRCQGLVGRQGQRVGVHGQDHAWAWA